MGPLSTQPTAVMPGGLACLSGESGETYEEANNGYKHSQETSKFGGKGLLRETELNLVSK